MASFQKFNSFVEQLAEAGHNLQSHTLKVMLTNAAPEATDAVKGDLTEISAGSGYTAGGSQATVSASAQTGGTYKLTLADVTFTATGGSIGPFRYAVLYNDTHASDALIGFWDYGSELTLNSGESFTWDADATNGVLQLS